MAELMRLAFAAILTCAVPLVSGAAAQTAAEVVRVEQPWARASIGMARPAAAYLTLVNEGSESVTLTAVETPLAGKAEVHETTEKDGVMRMAPAGPQRVPSGGSVRMAPGGLHVMLMNLAQPLKQGQTLPLTLRFTDGSSLEVSAQIQGVGSMGHEE